jgi:hypothetical protein
MAADPHIVRLHITQSERSNWHSSGEKDAPYPQL